jgi:uncharacterized protein (DUF608 family)
LADERVPLHVEITGWSPFIPNDADNSGLPVAAVEYVIHNPTHHSVSSVFSFNSANFMAANYSANPTDRIGSIPGGFLLYGKGARDHAWDEGRAAVWIDDPAVEVNHLWFRGDTFQSIQMAWNDIVAGRHYSTPPVDDSPSPGATIFMPFTLDPGEKRAIRVNIAWYVPQSNVYFSFSFDKNGYAPNKEGQTYQPWYSGRFPAIADLVQYWSSNCTRLKAETQRFSDALYKSTLPPEVMEAVGANLTFLKSPSCLRQTDGRFWGWEGSAEHTGTGPGGTMTSVYGCGQAMAHLFSGLERGIRETEFGPTQNSEGKQSDRAALPIRRLRDDEFKIYNAGTALVGTILFYREWRISGDTKWLKAWWPRIELAVDYSIEQLDPKRLGILGDNPMNGGDGELWGADPVAMSSYVEGLNAAIQMARALKKSVKDWPQILDKGKRFLEEVMFNGDYFEQYLDVPQAIIMIKNGRTKMKGLGGLRDKQSPEATALIEQIGPLGQLTKACINFATTGPWACWIGGMGGVLDAQKTLSHLMSVFRYNYVDDLGEVANTGRFFMGSRKESGLVLAAWPNGSRPPLPPYAADEVFSGQEYKVASHLVAMGKVEEGLKIVRATRHRYDGCVRNPFDEVEEGHWYARATASYALLQAFSGARYDAVDKVLYLKPVVKGDFCSFLSTATGYGNVGVRDGNPFCEVVSGKIPYSRIEYSAA